MALLFFPSACKQSLPFLLRRHVLSLHMVSRFKCRQRLGQLLAPLADLSVIVIEAEETRAAVAATLIERVAASGGKVAGVVLNMRRFHIPRFIYARI